jgi:hypothetical protein
LLRPVFHGGVHRNIHILENFARRNSQQAVGGFNQIVASFTAMFTPKHIPELEGTGELSGTDQKSRPIDLPLTFFSTHLFPSLGEGRFRTLLPTCNAVFVGWNFFVEGEKNLRVISGAVNPRILCKLNFCERQFSQRGETWKAWR